MVYEIFKIAADAGRAVGSKGGIPEGAGEGNFHMLRNVEETANLLLYVAVAKDGQYMEPNPERLAHEPHVLHYAAKAHVAQEIAVRAGRPLPGVIETNEEELSLPDRPAQKGQLRGVIGVGSPGLGSLSRPAETIPRASRSS